MADDSATPSGRPIEAIFSGALSQPPDERAKYVAGACGDDLHLRARIEALLRAHEAPEGFLPEEGGDLLPDLNSAGEEPPGATEKSGETIGRYKLVEQIGEGGFGSVYVAEQREPVKRRVALKIIKLGMDTKQVVARFQAERQALALMDHPSIAKVFDAGATDTGRPYFVMELVQGTKITEYCEQNQLSLRQRLELFIQVCHAVQHAHQKGIIHRDLKPSNILVTIRDGQPVPKIIDFGIAKATQVELTEQTVFTEFGQFIGTPAYISPEQAELSRMDVDTRSDIYSLGVLLYELLTGTTPFETKALVSGGWEEMRRTIKHQAPPRPSTRLSRALAATAADPCNSRTKNQNSKISSDLDWIVMKCLEKDRAMRYETANGLATDIERHLNHEPVMARPPSRFYEFQKTFRRHKVGFVATGAVIAALSLGLALSSWQAVRARRAEGKESRIRAEAQQNLYRSLLGEARATRLARLVGYRERVFTLLERAKAMDVPERNLAELRQEAVACLGDFVGLSPARFADFSTNIDSACLAASGKVAAFALHDRSIQLRDTESGKEFARLTYTNGDLLAVCFNPAGDRLYAVTEQYATNRSPLISDREVITWSRNGAGIWSEMTDRVVPGATSALFSTEKGVFDVLMKAGNLSSTTLDTNSVSFGLFNLSTGGLVPDYGITIEHPISTVSFSISRDGEVLAVASRDGPDSMTTLDLYRWGKGADPKTIRIAESLGFALSDDSKYVFVASEQGAVVYTFPSLERVAQIKELPAAASPAFGAGKLALAKIHQNRIRLWHLARGETLAMLDDPEFASPTCFTPDGNLLLTTGSQHARVYRLSTPEKVNLVSHAAPVPGVAFSPDGSRLASAAKDHSVRVCDATTGKVFWEANDLLGPGQCLSFSPNGRWLAVGIWDSYLVWIRDAETGQPLLELGPNSIRGRTVTRRLETVNSGPTLSVQFSPDGRYLATAGYATNGVRIYELQWHDQPSGSLDATLFKIAPSGASLAFAPDSRSVAFSSCSHPYLMVDEELLYWDFLHGAWPRRLGTSVIGRVEGCGFTPDSRYLLAIDKSSKVVTVDITTGAQLSSFEAWRSQPGQFVEATQFMALSPDGSKIAVSSSSRLGAVIRDTQTGKVIYSLPEEASTVYWLAWSPDSRRLAVSRDNGDIAIWNFQTVDQILAERGLLP